MLHWKMCQTFHILTQSNVYKTKTSNVNFQKKYFSPFRKGEKEGNFNVFFNINPFLVTSLERSTYQKINATRKRCLRHPCPIMMDCQSWPVLSNFVRLPFWTGLTHTPVSCTIDFLLLYNFKQNIS